MGGSDDENEKSEEKEAKNLAVFNDDHPADEQPADDRPVDDQAADDDSSGRTSDFDPEEVEQAQGGVV